MNLSADYEKLLSDVKREELVWIEEEFECLFSNKKGKFTDADKETANHILDNLTENINMLKNDDLIQILAKMLNKIEKKYPDLL